MRVTRLLPLVLVLPIFTGCASGGGPFACVPILCSFFGSPPEAPAPPPPPPPPPPPVAKPDPCAGRIVLRGVRFAFDSAQLDGASMVTLDLVAEQLGTCPGVRARVEGHTDSMGADGYNQSLSQRRAESVRKYLAEHGVGGGRLEAQGFGESQPVASNETAEGRALNRRVELKPIP